MGKKCSCAVLLFLLILIIFASRFLLLENYVLRKTISYLYQDLTINYFDKNLMLGSSTVELIDSTEDIECGIWVNRGIGNAKIKDLHRYLKISPIKIKPKKIILYAGDNDINFGVDPEIAFLEFQLLVKLIDEKFKNSRVYLIPVKFSPKRKASWEKYNKFNKNIIKLSQTMDSVAVLNSSIKLIGDEFFLEDGIHLNKKGRELLLYNLNGECK